MITRFFGLMICCISSVACASSQELRKAYSLGLNCSNDGIRLEVFKAYSVSETVNIRGAIGHSGSFDNEVSFNITDENGIKYDFLPQQRLSKATSEYFVRLHGNSFFGDFILFDIFHYNYELKSSSYSVQASYKNLHISDIDKYDEAPLESNLINIVVDDDGYQCSPVMSK